MRSSNLIFCIVFKLRRVFPLLHSKCTRQTIYIPSPKNNSYVLACLYLEMSVVSALHSFLYKLMNQILIWEWFRTEYEQITSVISLWVENKNTGRCSAGEREGYYPFLNIYSSQKVRHWYPKNPSLINVKFWAAYRIKLKRFMWGFQRTKMFPCGFGTFFNWFGWFVPQGSWVGELILESPSK